MLEMKRKSYNNGMSYMIPDNEIHGTNNQFFQRNQGESEHAIRIEAGTRAQNENHK